MPMPKASTRLSRAMRRSTRPRLAFHTSLGCSVTSVVLMKGEGSIAHDAGRIAGGVRRIAQIEKLRGEAPGTGRVQQAVDGTRAARLAGIERTAEREDLIGRLPVRPPRRVRREIVRKVRADDNRRLRAAPEAVQHLGHLLWSRFAHC